MKMKNCFILIIFCLIINGCTNSKKEEVKWFETENEAIQYGLNEEGLNSDDVISELEMNGELFIVFKKQEDSHLLVGLSNIAQKKNKFRWYRSNSFVAVEENINIGLITKTLSGKQFNFYTGISEGEETVIDTSAGNINPNIDVESGIYYFISNIN
ncbi:hypothetical protein FQ087_08950 [Sporosarcina sp. ANT_H38]|uniref:hypothetical protein n=1 Tax=Sporosarcina sp. ANT_H38 TaxID=2597358 RepID=UPI0011F3724C|nr:hypothetical protein [Sporosarcina sp. ANT_H38]KAA0966345.1 hypothetical protein FQ087_08950 [Sporosarcina sp. ANT_H38]